MRAYTEEDLRIMQLALEGYQGCIEEKITDLEIKLNQVIEIRKHLRKISKELKRDKKLIKRVN